MSIKDFFRKRRTDDSTADFRPVKISLSQSPVIFPEWYSYNNCVFRRSDISCIIKCHDGTADFILRNGKYIVSKMRYDRLLKALRISPADLNQLYKQTNTKDHE